MNRCTVLSALLSVSLASTAALAQSNAFAIVYDGKQVGKSVYTVKKTKKGFEMNDRSTYRLGGQDGDLSDEFHYGPGYNYIDGTDIDHNTQLQTSYVPSKAGDQVTISRFQQAGHDSNIVPAKPDMIVLPSFDAGSAQMALLYVKTSPTADSKYNVLFPGGAGGGARGGGGGRHGGGGTAPDDAAAMPTGDNTVDMLWVQGKDAEGSVDGKPVSLHTYELAAGRLRVILYADTQNTLMLADAPALKMLYIRNGFKLAPPPPAGVLSNN
jgi:type 1 fimbria pilin